MTAAPQPRTPARRFDSPEQEAYLALWRTYDRMRALEDDLFSRWELTAQQYNLLRLLRARHPDPVPTLSLVAGLVSRAPDVTRMFDKLEARGLIARTRSAIDRRAVLVAATVAGLALLDEIAGPLADCHRRQLGHLTASELQSFTALLHRARAPHEPADSPWRPRSRPMTTDTVISPDVVVIGGGPAGTATATMLAQKGLRVELFERDHFPRFHIGESLIPHTHGVLNRIGMLGKLKASPFVKKHGVQFVSDKGKLSEPFYFADHDPHERSQTWQVRRDEFDHLMLTNAREHGVTAHEGTRVLEVLFEGTRAVGVRVKPAGQPERVVRAKVVVDASGQSSPILDRLGLREWDPELKKAAVWTYWKGAQRGPGRDEGATIVLQTHEKKGWFWYIPLQDDVVSVGVVAGYEYLFQDRGTKDLETIYNQEVARCPGLQPRLEGATRCDAFRAQKEYSYRATQAAGDGWVLVGDAFGFLDPLYSSGVLLALISAEMAADAVGDALAVNDPSEARLRRWEPEYVRGMDRMRKLVIAFYEGLNFGKLVRQNPDKKGLITDVLIGNLFHDAIDDLWPLIDELRADEAAAGKLVLA